MSLSCRLIARSSAVILGCLLASQATGCGPSAVVNSPEIFDRATLEEVGDLYRSATGANKKPPGSLKDLARSRDLFMNGYNALEKGEVVAYWGVALSTGDQQTGAAEILAYNAGVPKQGGPVLLKDGSIRKMTAEEFQTAPKAGKE